MYFFYLATLTKYILENNLARDTDHIERNEGTLFYWPIGFMYQKSNWIIIFSLEMYIDMFNHSNDSTLSIFPHGGD